MTDFAAPERRAWLRCYQMALIWADQIQATRARLVPASRRALQRITTGTVVPFPQQYRRG